jgi:hypothetical protein
MFWDGLSMTNSWTAWGHGDELLTFSRVVKSISVVSKVVQSMKLSLIAPGVWFIAFDLSPKEQYSGVFFNGNKKALQSQFS